MQDVDLSYESSESRPSLIAQKVFDLTLEELKLQKSGGRPLIRLEKIDKLQVTRCPGLSERTVEQIDSVEE